MTEKGFEKAKQIRYDGYSISECTPTNTNAFSLPCFNFFYDCKDEFVNNIWILNSLITSTDHFDKILDTLYELGEGCELVLANWNSLELIDLQNRNQIKEYLMRDWR